MAQQNITIGAADAKAGDTLFSAFTKTEANFTELYTDVATNTAAIAAIPPFNATTDIIIDRVLEAVSLATSQEPTGLGIANSIKVEFGAAQFTVAEPVMIDVNGQVTFNVAGMYRVKSVFQFGRTGGAGTSEVFFRLLVNGVQLGRSVGVKLGNADVLSYIDIDNWFNVPAGTTLDTEIMRDNSGNNSGGIFKTTPTNEGAGTWSDVPCTVLRLERWDSP